MPKVIKSAGRKIVFNVRRACEEERDIRAPVVPFHKVRARVAYLTGVSERTITKITREGIQASASSSRIVTPGKTRNRKKPTEEIEDSKKCTIRHIIHSFYIKKKENPTVSKLWLELKKAIDFKYSKTSLRRLLNTLGFKYKTCQSKRKVLVERSDIAAWRANYILRLFQNRQEENRPVIYLKESHIELQKCRQSDAETGVLTTDSVGTKWIIAHAGGKTGFIENGLLLFKSKSKDYREDMNSANFTRWMKDKIMPNLPTACIIVMDNAAHHCTQINKVPTMGNTKAELQEWLMKTGIEIDNCWTKAQLYDLIKRRKGDPQYEIDQILNEHGHEVLRLPQHHYDLNPMEKIWEIVKKRIAEKIFAQAPSEIASFIEAAFKTVTERDWRAVCQRVEKVEDEYYNSDRLLDMEMDKFIITGDASDSSDDSDSDSDEDVKRETVDPLQDHVYTH